MREKISRRIYQNFPKLEAISLLLVIAGVALLKLGRGDYGPLLLVGLSTLAMSYFILVYLPPPQKGPWLLTIFHRVFPQAFAVSILGILFSLMQYPGADLMMRLGMVVMVIALLLFAWLKWRKSFEHSFYESLAYRGLFLFVLLLAFSKGWLKL